MRANGCLVLFLCSACDGVRSEECVKGTATNVQLRSAPLRHREPSRAFRGIIDGAER